MCVCGGGGGATIYVPISTEGPSTSTTRPKTGSQVKGLRAGTLKELMFY